MVKFFKGVIIVLGFIFFFKRYIIKYLQMIKFYDVLDLLQNTVEKRYVGC